MTWYVIKAGTLLPSVRGRSEVMAERDIITKRNSLAEMSLEDGRIVVGTIDGYFFKESLIPATDEIAESSHKTWRIPRNEVLEVKTAGNHLIGRFNSGGSYDADIRHFPVGFQMTIDSFTWVATKYYESMFQVKFANLVHDIDFTCVSTSILNYSDIIFRGEIHE